MDIALPELGSDERRDMEDAAEAFFKSLPKERQELLSAAFRVLRFHDDEPFCYEIVAAIIEGHFKIGPPRGKA